MAINITVDAHIPMPRRGINRIAQEHLPKRIRVLANTARLLASEGLNLTPTGSDQKAAAVIASEFAYDPQEAANNVSDKDLTTMTPASLVQADAILTEFGRQVVQNVTTLRHTITNKLILETEHPDPKVRLKALELLGKISDVGLFAEKSEITITHKTSDELRDALREKLENLRKPAPATQHYDAIEDAEFEEVFTLDDDLLDDEQDSADIGMSQVGDDYDYDDD